MPGYLCIQAQIYHCSWLLRWFPLFICKTTHKKKKKKKETGVEMVSICPETKITLKAFLDYSWHHLRLSIIINFVQDPTEVAISFVQVNKSCFQRELGSFST